MIIEFFGAPGAGKSTLAHALVARLRQQGYGGRMVLTHQPRKLSIVDIGGVGYALIRVIHAALGILAMVLHPIANRRAFRVALGLIKIMPPRNPVWLVRIGQYVLRLSKVWHRSSDIDPILVFDQAYIQAICSLAVFHGSIDDVAMLRALDVIPKSDIVIYVKVEQDQQKLRLRNRVGNIPPAARLFEASEVVNSQFSPIVERLSELLAQDGRRVVVVQVEGPAAIERAIDEIERLVVEKISSISALNARERTPSPASEPQRKAAAVVRAAGDVRRRLAEASIYALLVYVGGAGLTCFVQLWIARLLHAEGYGVYSYVWAWVSLLSYGATLGLVSFVLRFASFYRASEKWALMSGTVHFALKRSLAAAVAVSACGLLILWLRSGNLQREFVVSMAIGLMTVPLITLHLVCASVVRVFGGLVSAVLPERVLRDVSLLAILGVVTWGTLRPVNVETVLAGSLVSNAATLAIVAFFAIKRWPAQIARTMPEYAPRDWWTFAFPVMTMLALEVLIARSGVMVLGWRQENFAAGVFALAFNLAMLVQLSRAAVGIYFSPAAAELHARGDRAGLQSLFARATMLSAAGGIMLAVPVLTMTQPLLHLFGRDFDGASHIAQILVLGQVVAALAGPQQNLLTMTGHERSAALSMLVFTGLTFIGCALAAIHHGAFGAAVATALVLAAWNATMAVQVERRLGMKPGLVLFLAEVWGRRQRTAIMPHRGDADVMTP